MITVENLVGEEIEPYFKSLSKKELSGVPAEARPDVKYAKLVTIARINNELAGIGGIIEGHPLLFSRLVVVPSLFIGVKPQFRRQGAGDEMMQNIIAFTRNRYNCLTLTTWGSTKYIPAVNLYIKNGFKVAHFLGNQYYMWRSFSARGEIIGRLSSIIYAIYYAVSRSLGRGLRCIRAR